MAEFQFDGTRFDAEKGQLTREGQSLDLRPKTADLLRLLIERGDQVVSKEDLFAAIWPDTAVSDATLVQSIQELRKEMKRHAAKLEFERAAELRDRIKDLEAMQLEIAGT